MLIIADFLNFIFALTILLIVYRIHQLSLPQLIILIIHLLAIFGFNNFLFDPSYMPDQYQYLLVAQNCRNFDFFNEANFHSGLTVYLSGLFFCLFPIPFIVSVYSLGIINFLLYFWLFIFMKRNDLFSNKIIMFYLFYPSLLLYSSLALRDMLIFILMFLIINSLLIRPNFISILASSFYLSFIKAQNLIIIIISYIISIFTNRKVSSTELVFGLFLLPATIYYSPQYFSIDNLNAIRLSFYNENINHLTQEFVNITSLTDIIYHFLPGIFYFFFRPLPWIEHGNLIYLQFTENILLSLVILYIFHQQYKYELWKIHKIKFLNVLLFVSLCIYGLVIFNSGTAVRYKFPFIAIYIIFSLHFISKHTPHAKEEPK